MGVHDQTYKGYDGVVTPPWSRALVFARYALADAFRSRAFLVFYVLILAWPLFAGLGIYLANNLPLIEALSGASEFLQINEWYFRTFFLSRQLWAAFLLVMIVGPATVSPDLRNNALALMLSRPIEKTDYVLGKLAIPFVLSLSVTLVPGVLLFFLQSSLADDWMLENLRILVALCLSSLLWCFVISVVSLAVSAWVKWKPWARTLYLAMAFVGAAVGTVWNAIYHTWMGSLVNVFMLNQRAVEGFFGASPGSELPFIAALGTLALLAAAATILLFRRLRAYEVVG